MYSWFCGRLSDGTHSSRSCVLTALVNFTSVGATFSKGEFGHPLALEWGPQWYLREYSPYHRMCGW